MMTPQALPLLLTLILVHLVADFFMQSKAGIEEKANRRWRSRFLYLHCLIHALVSFPVIWVATADLFQSLMMTAVVGISHLFIDMWKSYTQRNRTFWYVLDQILHFSVILLVWLQLSGQWALVITLRDWLFSPVPLTLAIAYLLTTRPIGFLIASAIGRWSQEIDNSGTLGQAGARIGLLERFLVLTFILVDQFAAIGFLLAAKSVFRYGDLREAHQRQLTEYVLLGTMLSFASTIVLGLLTRELLARL
jgi:hypothetical protein